MSPGAETSEVQRTGRLPWTVIALGLTSFFADVGSEMIFPLLPVFLTEVLRAGPSFLGIVEGAADTVSGLLRLAAGNLADRLPRRKPLVVFGYALAGLARPLVAFATAPWHVLAIRLTDRVGKGTRSAPRDALIVDTALPGSRTKPPRSTERVVAPATMGLSRPRTDVPNTER